MAGPSAGTRFVAAVLCCVLALSLLGPCAADGWRDGRASFYGNDAWSIHRGNCGFGYIHPDQPAGWDVAALSDRFPSFAGSCGACYEVRCRPAPGLTDGYGKKFDRSTVCYNSAQSLLIRVVDSCPCNYPGNYYSNKRWCCGDVDHMDMSVWAFEKLADKKWGVMGIQYRPVPCNFVPANPAPSIPNPTPGEKPQGKTAPSFMQTGDMSVPKRWNPQQGPVMVQGWQFGDPSGSSSERRASSTPPGAAASASASRGNSSATATSASSAGGAAQQAGAALAQALGFGVQGSGAQVDSGQGAAAGDQGVVYRGGLQNGWRDASYSSSVEWSAGSFGADGGGSVCADLRPGGALAVTHAPGAFAGAESLEWRVRTSEGRPEVTVNVAAGKRYCSPLPLASLPVLESRAGWARYSVSLGDFGGKRAPGFQGCGGAAAGQLTSLEFKSSLSAGRQVVCLDLLRLLPRASTSS